MVKVQRRFPFLKLIGSKGDFSSELNLSPRMLSPGEWTGLKFGFSFHLACLHSVGQPIPVTGSKKDRSQLVPIQVGAVLCYFLSCQLITSGPTPKNVSVQCTVYNIITSAHKEQDDHVCE